MSYNQIGKKYYFFYLVSKFMKMNYCTHAQLHNRYPFIIVDTERLEFINVQFKTHILLVS
jgi:hypothetical protein